MGKYWYFYLCILHFRSFADTQLSRSISLSHPWAVSPVFQVFCAACCSLKCKLLYMDRKEARVCVICHSVLMNGEWAGNLRCGTSLVCLELQWGHLKRKSKYFICMGKYSKTVKMLWEAGMESLWRVEKLVRLQWVLKAFIWECSTRIAKTVTLGLIQKCTLYPLLPE